MIVHQRRRHANMWSLLAPLLVLLLAILLFMERPAASLPGPAAPSPEQSP